MEQAVMRGSTSTASIDLPLLKTIYCYNSIQCLLDVRLVVAARHNLRDKPDAEHLYADDHQQYAEQQQRPVADGLSQYQLDVNQVQVDSEAKPAHQDAQPAEDVRGSRTVAQEEAHGEQVEQHLERAPDAVFAFPVAALA